MAKYNAYPQEIIDYVREHGSAYSIQDMADLVSEKFGRPVTYGQMQSFYKNHKVHALPMKGRTRRGIYPEDMEAFMRETAPGRSSHEIMELVNARFGEGTMSLSQVRAYKKNHKIVSGYDSRFPKGHVPANKGKHMETRGRDEGHPVPEGEQAPQCASDRCRDRKERWLHTGEGGGSGCVEAEAQARLGAAQRADPRGRPRRFPRWQQAEYRY